MWNNSFDWGKNIYSTWLTFVGKNISLAHFQITGAYSLLDNVVINIVAVSCSSSNLLWYNTRYSTIFNQFTGKIITSVVTSRGGWEWRVIFLHKSMLQKFHSKYFASVQDFSRSIRCLNIKTFRFMQLEEFCWNIDRNLNSINNCSAVLQNISGLWNNREIRHGYLDNTQT